MGLDWNPGNRPKPGCEAEFAKLIKAIKQANGRKKESLLERFREISITAYETLQAPRIGHDQTADDWAREIYAQQEPELPLEDWLGQYKGYYVLPLVPPCDGLPRYSNAALGYVEEFSFRAEFLRDCEEILGEDLLERGYETMTAEEMGAYGAELLGRAETYAREQGIAMDELETEDEESPQFKLDVMLAAGRWCRFWAERGHILDPYW